MVTSLGVVAVADKLVPGLMKDASHVLGKVVFLPHLESWERGIHKLTKIDDFKVDTTKSREARADEIARATILFGASWAASFASKMAGRRWLNNVFKVPQEHRPDAKWYKPWVMTDHEKVLVLTDELAHYGSLVYLNTVGAKVSDELMGATTNILKMTGMSERKAKDISAMTVIWELPNLLGLAAGVGGIFGVHHKQWDQKMTKLVDKMPHRQKMSFAEKELRGAKYAESDLARG